MKHLNTILFILFAALFLPGCSGYDIDSLFDKPAEARVQDSLSAVKKELTEAADGWIATYKIGESAITLYLHIRFNPDNTLSLQIPNKDGSADVKEGSYTLSYTQQFNLIFDTKSFFSDLTKINLGDFIFELGKKEDGQYIFHGFDNETKKQTCTLILRKATKDEKVQHASMTTDEYIVLTTANNEGQWDLFIYGENCWADLNSNERFDSGEEIVRSFLQPIQSQEIKIYGNNILSLICVRNNLTSIDISHCPKIEELNCSMNQLTVLDIFNNNELRIIDCSENQLSSLDVSKNTTLFHLLCRNNQLRNLDVTKNIKLAVIDCAGNQLTELDVTKNIDLAFLTCYMNQLADLDVTNNIKLKDIRCRENQLTELDVTKNIDLAYLDCYMNQLADLDVTNNRSLLNLTCAKNQLTNLDISQNIKLLSLICCDNQLTSLDMDTSSNQLLTFLNCMNNQIKDKDMTDLVNSLPSVSYGFFISIDTKSSSEGNICTREQVNQAKSKGWNVYDYNGGQSIEYEGS